MTDRGVSQTNSNPDTTMECPSGSQTETICEEASSSEERSAPRSILHLRLQPPREEHKVKWTTDTVDNEFMGKKKSKCCCIYEKPKLFGESSSSEEDEDDEGCTPNCRGHKKKCYRHKKLPHDHEHDHDSSHDGSGSSEMPDRATAT